ncbi:MAG: cell division protein FtsA [Verrucomicrobia bacterium]|nr:cell division protein FtsA [Verrucomicrobiota bacterium]
MLNLFFPKKTTVIVGLEIGTAKVAAVVGEVTEAGGVNIIGVGQCPSRGVRKGEVVNASLAAEDVRNAIVEAEKSADVEIASVYLGVTGGHLTSLNTHGVFASVSLDHEISQQDVGEVLANAKVFNRPSENYVLHSIRQHFTVNGQAGIVDPVGMLGEQLEVDLHVIHGVTTRLQNHMRVVKGLNLEIEDTVFSGLCSALALLDNEQKQMGALVVDIGAGTTEYVVYADGVIKHTGVLAVGGDHVTNDLSYGLRMAPARAALLKREHGAATTEGAAGQTLTLTSENGFPDRRVDLHDLRRIMVARLEEAFQLIDEEIGEQGFHDQLRAGVCLCGGGARIRGIEKLAADVFGLPATLGRANAVGGLRSATDDPELATAVGLVKYGAIRQKGQQSVGLVGKLKHLAGSLGLF